MIIGRIREQENLRYAYNDEVSHFIAVYGRRRIGKTFLVRETFNNNFTFQHTGLSNQGIKNQLAEFDASLKEYGLKDNEKSQSWLDAFRKLKKVIIESSDQRKVIFIDELSWMDTPKSDLISAIENFWNTFASTRKDVVLIVCSSATSWIIKKVLHNKGGLYNRLTDNIHLDSFSLLECEEYLSKRNVTLSRSQILELYMIFGGVPFYWSLIKKGLSVTQIVDDILFKRDAMLKDEFKYLYASIFNRPEKYLVIVETLARKKVGMTREELIEKANLRNSGGLTDRLEELEKCGFIRKYNAFGMKKKNTLYQLIDNFTLFYYKFMQDGVSDEHFWENQLNTPLINTWRGLSFERVCLSHIRQIKQALGISGVLTETNSWYCKPNKEEGINGSQIDLLIVRRDQIINLCEMKYANTNYVVNKALDESIRNKINDLQLVTKTRYAIHPTLITTYGVVNNQYSSIIQSILTLDDLFKEI